MLVADRWQSLMDWISEKVNAVATFIWDGENNKLFGFEIPEIRMPEFSLPDFSAILEGIKQKFTGSVADMLDNIPKWALPAAAEEWIAANKAQETTAMSDSNYKTSPSTVKSNYVNDLGSASSLALASASPMETGYARNLVEAVTPGAKIKAFENTSLDWMNMTLGGLILAGVEKVKSTVSGNATPVDAGMIGGNPHAGMAAIVSEQVSKAPPIQSRYAGVVDASNNTSIRTDNSRRSNIVVRHKPPATSYDPHKTATYARFRGRFGGQ